MINITKSELITFTAIALVTLIIGLYMMYWMPVG